MQQIKTAIFCLLAVGIFFTFSLFSAVPCFAGGENYTYYTGNGSQNCQIVTFDKFDPIKRISLKNVCGEGCEYQGSDVQWILAEYNAEIVFTETLCDSVNYYCRAPLPYSTILYGKEINLHICVKGEKIKVASPIIFGGY
jgi:hypothetical protein